MKLQELELALSEELDLLALLERATAKREAKLQAEREQAHQERLAELEAKRLSALENLTLCEKLYQSAVKDGLTEAIRRAGETYYRPSDVEKMMIADEIAFDSSKVRSSTWRYFPDNNVFLIQRARHNLSMARQKLSRILQEQLSYEKSGK